MAQINIKIFRILKVKFEFRAIEYPGNEWSPFPLSVLIDNRLFAPKVSLLQLNSESEIEYVAKQLQSMKATGTIKK